MGKNNRKNYYDKRQKTDNRGSFVSREAILDTPFLETKFVDVRKRLVCVSHSHSLCVVIGTLEWANITSIWSIIASSLMRPSGPHSSRRCEPRCRRRFASRAAVSRICFRVCVCVLVLWFLLFCSCFCFCFWFCFVFARFVSCLLRASRIRLVTPHATLSVQRCSSMN